MRIGRQVPSSARRAQSVARAAVSATPRLPGPARSQRQRDVGLEEAQLVAAVVAPAVEAQAMERLAADQPGHAVGELDLAAGAGLLLGRDGRRPRASGRSGRSPPGATAPPPACGFSTMPVISASRPVVGPDVERCRSALVCSRGTSSTATTLPPVSSWASTICARQGGSADRSGRRPAAPRTARRRPGARAHQTAWPRPSGSCWRV